MISSATDLQPWSGEIAYDKYVLFGNTFLVVDETRTPLRDDAERTRFARWALDGYFGVGGADNVIYLGRLASLPDSPRTFRIFELDGSESLSCGNGLLSAAAFLDGVDAGREWQVFTELPTGMPRAVRVGVRSGTTRTWVDMGRPRATPAALFHRSGPSPLDGIDVIEHLEVEFPTDRKWARGLPRATALSGWLVFTGEPHLVLVLGRGLPVTFDKRVFPERDREIGGEVVGRESSQLLLASNALIDHIGAQLNASYRARFPAGVHVNLVQVRDEAGLLEYRTWERAIDQETLACGTGALACAYVCGARRFTKARRTTLWPHRCRWYQPDAELYVTDTPAGLTLDGQPVLACSGTVPPSAGIGRHSRAERPCIHG